MLTLVRRIGVAFLSLSACSPLSVDRATADDAVMSGGAMGNGTWYGAGTLWLPTLVAVVVLGAVLYVVLRVRK